METQVTPSRKSHLPSKMLNSLFGRKKTRPFKDYYTEWIHVLKTTHLPILRHSITATATSCSPILLSIHVELLHHHFQSYYKALDLAASNDVAQVLFPDWRNPLEKPFLWLGDLHPYLFTNLLRSFLQSHDDADSSSDSSPDRTTIHFTKSCDFLNSQWLIENAWRDSEGKLMTQVDQIECGLRLMVPSLADRAKKAQAKFVERIGTEWGETGEKKKAAIREAAVAEMEELAGVFSDANRLRSNVISEIVGATSVYQGAMFLEALAQFLVGLRDKNLVKEFEHCKLTVN